MGGVSNRGRSRRWRLKADISIMTWCDSSMTVGAAFCYFPFRLCPSLTFPGTLLCVQHMSPALWLRNVCKRVNCQVLSLFDFLLLLFFAFFFRLADLRRWFLFAAVLALKPDQLPIVPDSGLIARDEDRTMHPELLDAEFVIVTRINSDEDKVHHCENEEDCYVDAAPGIAHLRVIYEVSEMHQTVQD